MLSVLYLFDAAALVCIGSRFFSEPEAKKSLDKFVADMSDMQDTNINVYGKSHSEHIANIVELLKDCDAVVVAEIGSRPQSALEEAGKKLLISEDEVEEAVRKASKL